MEGDEVMIKKLEELRKEAFDKVKKETEEKIQEKEKDYEKLKFERLKIDINSNSKLDENVSKRIQDICQEEQNLKKQIAALAHRLEKIKTIIASQRNK